MAGVASGRGPPYVPRRMRPAGSGGFWRHVVEGERGRPRRKVPLIGCVTSPITLRDPGLQSPRTLES